MKEKKIHILLMLSILLGYAPLQCMTRLWRQPTKTRPVAIAPIVRQPAAFPAAKPESIVKEQAKPISSSASIAGAASPFGRGGQRRMYGTTSGASTQKSFWDKFTSFFRPKLTAEEFFTKFEDVLEKHGVPVWIAPNGRTYHDRWTFDVADFETAKKLIEENENFINEQFYSHFGYISSFKRFGRYSKPYKYLTATILDVVLMKVFMGDWGILHGHDVTPSDNALNLIKLAQYIIDKGGVINPEVKLQYEEVYLNKLMPAYKQLYSNDPLTRYGAEYELEMMKNIFKELDPILERLIPEFKEKLHKAQQERSIIEKNESTYRAQIKDKEDRAEFLREKIKMQEIEWRRTTGKWDDIDYPYSGWRGINWEEPEKNSQWNESEYQAWLKNGKKFGYQNFRFEYRSEQAQVPRYEGKSIWDLLPGLTMRSPKQKIAEAYRKFMKENHPDTLGLKKLSDKDKKRKLKKVQKVNAAWDAYNEALKKQQATE